ncbi:MAG: YebC/PmpR family DNA-binding transcriptional regulator [Patescibacteria group bacterium]|jgi:YebC/PmpR family DNA-binding regulatory protein|nr:YebC/PmpR family DNA-binding transcriptional regulator [Patescibacteria group bacterium]
MSGHSKWATTHRQKAVVDAKRGAIFTKLGNAITIAARAGGDPEANPSLRTAIDRAKSSSMPKDNIERAIKKGTGELGGDIVEEIYYEGILPPNIQVIVKCLTDNKNRSGSSVRHIFTKNGGSLSSVMWNFFQAGVIRIEKEELNKINVDELELELIDKNILDFHQEEEGIVIQTEVADLQSIEKYLKDKGLNLDSAEIEYVAKEKIDLENKESEKIDRLLEELEDNEDVSTVFTNLN